ncbi:hypothetical protein JOC85_002600 [Bacillus mesophilus]|uniref:hypothetical protein n=1 Tax=Bacillus mesophilus TaxID=1808955 RepID=UPI001EF935DF|nr:hypothetical protein [Bacillus mesophilus]MBM7661793.1 hypothetical protein [Bacillus mesophilus]
MGYLCPLPDTVFNSCPYHDKHYFQHVFRITTNEKEPTFADELDKLIELKAQRNSFFVFIIGFLIAMGSLVFFQPSHMMFIILITSGFISDVMGSLTKLYHYRRGV